MMDWWFNANRYASGTISCVGLLQHIAIGENVEITKEKILCHIEGYTHNFTVDGEGNRIFRTSIDFSRGISSDSTETEFKYIYGESNFGGSGVIASVGALTQPPTPQENGIFGDDVANRVAYTELNPMENGKPTTKNVSKISSPGAVGDDGVVGSKVGNYNKTIVTGGD
jgi:hypothetical protein